MSQNTAVIESPLRCQCCGHAIPVRFWERHPHPPTVMVTPFNPEALVLALALVDVYIDESGVSHSFLSSWVVKRARRDPDGPLAVAIGGRGALKLGKAFEKIAGLNFAGFRLERIDEEGGVAVWQVTRA